MRAKIALVGKARAGKNHIADILTEKYGFKQYAFADELKEVTRQLFPDFYKDGKKPRALLQDFGQFCRSFDEDVWVKALFTRMNRELVAAHFVVTDVRQPNEVEALRKAGFVIVKVVADDDVRLERMRATGEVMSDQEMNHETEANVDHLFADHVIENNGGDLSAAIEEIVFGLPRGGL